MPISDKLIDLLLEGNSSPEDLFGDSGLLKQLTKKITERALDAEILQHLGYARHDPAGTNSGNSRNGKSTKVHDKNKITIKRKDVDFTLLAVKSVSKSHGQGINNRWLKATQLLESP